VKWLVISCLCCANFGMQENIVKRRMRVKIRELYLWNTSSASWNCSCLTVMFSATSWLGSSIRTALGVLNLNIQLVFSSSNTFRFYHLVIQKSLTWSLSFHIFSVAEGETIFFGLVYCYFCWMTKESSLKR